MEKRQKSLLRIAGILLMIYCIYSLITTISMISINLAGAVLARLSLYNTFIIYSVINILELISIGFIAVVLLKGRYNKLLGITFGIFALFSLASLVINMSLLNFINFLIPALLFVGIVFEKQVSNLKKPIALLCTYLSVAVVLITVINLVNMAEPPERWGRYPFISLYGYLNYFFFYLFIFKAIMSFSFICVSAVLFIFQAIMSFSFICVSAVLANNPLNEKKTNLNKLGSIGLICLPVGTVLGLLIALISSLIYGGVYFFDGFFVTGILWAIVLLLVIGGTALSPLAIIYPAKSRAMSAHYSTNSGIDNDGYISLGKHIVLCLFTFGIWYLIWIHRTTAFLNRTPNAEQHNPTSKLLLFMFVPFYSIYWFYKQGQRIDMLSKSKNLNHSDMATTCLVLGIFIPIVACILMQDRINNICQAKANINNNTEKELENLQQLKKLLDSGILTQAEFDAKKKQLLRL